MNEFKKSLRNINNKAKDKFHMWNFYKTYEKNKDNKKIYKGRIIQANELNNQQYLGGVSCFIIDENGKVLIEKRGNTKITAGEVDLCSGHIDNNETPTQAMIREYVEELHNGSEEEREVARNEAINKIKKIEELDLIFENKGKQRKFFIQFYVMRTDLKNITAQKEEISDIDWIPMQELFELIRTGKTKFPYDIRYEKIFNQVQKHYEENHKYDNQMDR